MNSTQTPKNNKHYNGFHQRMSSSKKFGTDMSNKKDENIETRSPHQGGMSRQSLTPSVIDRNRDERSHSRRESVF